MTSKTTLLLAVSAILPATALIAWQTQQTATTLPAPFATPSAKNGPKVVAQPDGVHLRVPKGFAVELYAEGFKAPRFMLQGAAGEVLISDAVEGGGVYALVNHPGASPEVERHTLIEGLERPYGLAIWKNYLYVGERTSIKRYPYDAGAFKLGPGEEIVSLKGFDKGHWTRSLLFDRKGERLYVGIGSGSNIDTGDDAKRAAINTFDPAGQSQRIYASGTRNPIGLHWYPGTDTLWAAVQERDGLGDDLVPDFFTHIQQGGFYGWPFAYLGPNEEPRHKGEAPELVKKTLTPDVLLQSHVAVLDFTFYSGTRFPKKYQGGAFLAFHGSSNRAKRVGYEVAFLPFRNGKPSGAVEDFLTGWMMAPDASEVWGRPVAVLELKDGSLLVSDDGGKKVWRISYRGN